MARSTTSHEDWPSLREALAGASDWSSQSLHRCLVALSHRTQPTDRAVLLRQAASLSDNILRLPRRGWALELDELGTELSDRFGVDLDHDADHWIAHLRGEGSQREGWPEGLERGLHVESRSRRAVSAASPDGALLRLSPHTHYRTPTQKAAARALLTMPEGAAMLVSMPTGAGKSLLFQLGARWWRERSPHACVVVVVPTVGLALDHERNLRAMPGLERCRAITGALSAEERGQVLRELLRGEIPIVVMNPETAFFAARELLEQLCAPPDQRLGEARGELAALFVDEAHIIESWGRSFRPDFQRLSSLVSRLRERNPALRVALLSATLSDEACALLRRDYAGAAEFTEIHAGVARYELDLFAAHYPSQAARDRVLLDVIDRLPRPTIVYTTTCARARQVRDQLHGAGYSALDLFTGDTGAHERGRILQAWRDDELDLIVATSAFGMGIDKPNVRAVVHACLPEDAARYYQEVGRAGRDGHKAVGVCLWTDWDEKQAQSMKCKEWLTVDLSIKRWQRIVEDCLARGPSRTDAKDGRRILKVDINVAYRELGSHTGERNREWNRTLLNLMHRSRAIEITDVDRRSRTWTLKVADTRILTGEEAVLRALFSLRERERAEANASFRAFVELIGGPDCLLAETFAQIESGSPLAHECGHCGPCLANEEVRAPEPEQLQFGGLAHPWATPQLMSSRSPDRGTLLVEHQRMDFEALLAQLVAQLTRLGYDQFLVSDQHAAESAAHAKSLGGPGLILGFEEKAVHEWAPLEVPTVALLDPAGVRVYEDGFLREHLRRPKAERPPLLIVAPAGHELDGRRTSSLVDATYTLDNLHTWLDQPTTRVDH